MFHHPVVTGRSGAGLTIKIVAKFANHDINGSPNNPMYSNLEILMRLHLRNQNVDETLPSPLTGKPIQLKIRAFCPKCGCLISHKSLEAVKTALANWQSCKKCGCVEAAVKYTLEEEILGTHCR